MKKLSKLTSALLITLLIMLLGQTVFAQSSELPENMIDIVPTQLTFDKNSIKSGEAVTATLTLENQSAVGLSQVSLNTALPAGLSADNAAMTYDQIAAGQKVTHSFIVRADGTAAGTRPNTGDSFPTAILIIIMISALILGVVFVRARNRQKQKMLSLFICLCLSAQLGLALLPAKVSAQEDSESPSVLENISYEVSGKLLVNDSEQTITSTINIGSFPFSEMVTDYEQLTTATTVAANAKFFEVIVSSKRAFADSISPDDIVCTDAFGEAKIETVILKDKNTLSVKMTGPLNQEIQSCGVLYFDKACFAEAGEKAGALIVEVATPAPYFAEGSESVAISDDGSVDLAFCIDTAEFADNIGIEHISFDNPAIKPVALTVPSTESRRDGIIKVQVVGTTDPTAIIDTLAGASMTIAGDGLNCDSLSFPVRIHEEAVQPFLVLDEVTYNPDDAGEATASFVGLVRSLDGSVDLTQGTVDIKDTLDNSIISATTIADGENDAFVFDVSLAQDSLKERYEAGGESGVRSFFIEWACNQSVILTGNGVSDIYGIPVGDIESGAYVYDINELLDESDQSDQSVVPYAANRADIANSANGFNWSDLEDPDYRDVIKVGKKVSTYVSGISKSIKSFVSGDFKGGIGAIMGLGIGKKNEPTMTEISQSIAELDKSIAEVNNGVQKIYHEVTVLGENEKKQALLAFEKEIAELGRLTGRVSNKDKDTLTAIANLEDPESEEYKALAAKLCSDVERENGGASKIITQTMDVGKTLIGSTQGGAIVEYYDTLLKSKYNWQSQVNEISSAYWACQYQSYLKGYMICMFYMQSNNEDYYYSNDIAEMENQANAIANQWEAMQASLTLPEGQDKNLVDGKNYTVGAGSTTTLDLQNDITTLVGGRIEIPFSFKQLMEDVTEIRQISQYQKEGKSILTAATLTEMQKRVKASDNNTLYDEMIAVGIDLPSEYIYLGNENIRHDKYGWHTVPYTSLATGNKLTAMLPALQWCFGADIYDLKNHQLSSNTRLVTFDIKQNLDKSYNIDNFRLEYNNTAFVPVPVSAPATP